MITRAAAVLTALSFLTMVIITIRVMATSINEGVAPNAWLMFAWIALVLWAILIRWYLTQTRRDRRPAE